MLMTLSVMTLQFFFIFEVNCSMFVGFLLQYYGKL